MLYFLFRLIFICRQIIKAQINTQLVVLLLATREAKGVTAPAQNRVRLQTYLTSFVVKPIAKFSEPTNMESWVKTARESVSKFLCLESLSTRFHELKEVLQAARCTVTLESDTLGHLDKYIDEVFYNACKLAFESRDLVQLFESRCERALLDVGTITLHVKAGQIKRATGRLHSLHEMSRDMQKKSAEMVRRFLSFSQGVHEITKRMRDQKNVDRDRLDNMLHDIDSLLKKSRRELNEHKEMKEQAKKELQEKNRPLSPDKQGSEYFFKCLKSLSVKIYSFLEMKAEIHHSDTKEEESSLRRSAEALEIASKKQQDSVQEVIQLQTKRTNVVKGKKSNIDTFVSCMEKSVRLMDSLKITIDDMCSFWKHLEECCTTTAEETDLALKDIKPDPEKNKSCLEYPGVEESMQQFNAFWKGLKEVCTESKERLKEVAEALKSVYMKILSPEEAMSYVQTNSRTDHN